MDLLNIEDEKEFVAKMKAHFLNTLRIEKQNYSKFLCSEHVLELVNEKFNIV